MAMYVCIPVYKEDTGTPCLFAEALSEVKVIEKTIHLSGIRKTIITFTFSKNVNTGCVPAVLRRCRKKVLYRLKYIL
jgi:hypothetical protein